MNFLDVQSCWEIPCIAYFCSLFKDTFKLPTFEIEELEEALFVDTVDDTSLLPNIIISLLNGCYKGSITLSNYQMFLRRSIRRNSKIYNLENPFDSDIDFLSLPVRHKLQCLQLLCDYRLSIGRGSKSKDKLEETKVNGDALRLDPLGTDSKGSTYWHFYGNRLYREDKVAQVKHTRTNNINVGINENAVWQVICFTESDWIQLANKFTESSSSVDRAIGKVLTSLIPNIHSNILNKELKRRRRLLASRQTNQGNSSNYLDEDDDIGEQRRLAAIKRAERYERRSPSTSQSIYSTYANSSHSTISVASFDQSDIETDPDDQLNNTEPVSQSKKEDKENINLIENRLNEEFDRLKQQQKMAPTQTVTATTAAKLPGRQTNNSLSSLTGNIFIQPTIEMPAIVATKKCTGTPIATGNKGEKVEKVKDDQPIVPRKKKVKSSEVFMSTLIPTLSFTETEEVLQIGMHKVLEYVKNHKDAWPFMDPVEEDIAPRYYSIIRRPMDLLKMEEKLDNGEYQTFPEFRNDFKLIVNNCRLYNGHNNEYTDMVNNLQTAFEKASKKYFEQNSSDEEISLEYPDLKTNVFREKYFNSKNVNQPKLIDATATKSSDTETSSQRKSKESKSKPESPHSDDDEYKEIKEADSPRGTKRKRKDKDKRRKKKMKLSKSDRSDDDRRKENALDSDGVVDDKIKSIKNDKKKKRKPSPEPVQINKKRNKKHDQQQQQQQQQKSPIDRDGDKVVEKPKRGRKPKSKDTPKIVPAVKGVRGRKKGDKNKSKEMIDDQKPGKSKVKPAKTKPDLNSNNSDQLTDDDGKSISSDGSVIDYPIHKPNDPKKSTGTGKQSKSLTKKVKKSNEKENNQNHKSKIIEKSEPLKRKKTKEPSTDRSRSVSTNRSMSPIPFVDLHKKYSSQTSASPIVTTPQTPPPQTNSGMDKKRDDFDTASKSSIRSSVSRSPSPSHYSMPHSGSSNNASAIPSRPITPDIKDKFDLIKERRNRMNNSIKDGRSTDSGGAKSLLDAITVAQQPEKNQKLKETIEKLKVKNKKSKERSVLLNEIFCGKLPKEVRDERTIFERLRDTCTDTTVKKTNIPKKPPVDEYQFPDDTEPVPIKPTVTPVKATKEPKPQAKEKMARKQQPKVVAPTIKNSVKKPNKTNMEALELETEQTLKDINRWLEHTPRLDDFNSASNSPSRYNILDDFDAKMETTDFQQPVPLPTIQPKVEPPKIEPVENNDFNLLKDTPTIFLSPQPPVTAVIPPLGNAIPPVSPVIPVVPVIPPQPAPPVVHKQTIQLQGIPPAPGPHKREPKEPKRKTLKEKLTNLPKRKDIHRTIDRLAAGKTKGNMMNALGKLDDTAVGLTKEKPVKNSLVQVTSETGPKLSLGSVLDTAGFGLVQQHNFGDDLTKGDIKISEEISKDRDSDDMELEEIVTSTEPKENVETANKLTEDDLKIDPIATTKKPVETKDKPSATPNLSAWFKAFGAPKNKTKRSDDDEGVSSAVGATRKPEEQKDYETETKSDVNESPQPITDFPLPAVQRTRKASTGSSISERSSYSQDPDSPRIGIDERLGAYPAPYPSPLGASPIMASPKDDLPVKPASPYPINGAIKVGFYQDTTTKSSPEKSCSPREQPSPYSNYAQHLYSSATPAGTSVPTSYGCPYNNPLPQPVEPQPTPLGFNNKKTPSYYDQYKQPRSQESDYNSSMSPNPNSPYQNPQQSPYQQPQNSPYQQSQTSPYPTAQTVPPTASPQYTGNSPYPQPNSPYEQPNSPMTYPPQPPTFQQPPPPKPAQQLPIPETNSPFHVSNASSPYSQHDPNSPYGHQSPNSPFSPHSPQQAVAATNVPTIKNQEWPAGNNQQMCTGSVTQSGQQQVPQVAQSPQHIQQQQQIQPQVSQQQQQQQISQIPQNLQMSQESVSNQSKTVPDVMSQPMPHSFNDILAQISGNKQAVPAHQSEPITHQTQQMITPHLQSQQQSIPPNAHPGYLPAYPNPYGPMTRRDDLTNQKSLMFNQSMNHQSIPIDCFNNPSQKELLNLGGYGDQNIQKSTGKGGGVDEKSFDPTIDSRSLETPKPSMTNDPNKMFDHLLGTMSKNFPFQKAYDISTSKAFEMFNRAANMGFTKNFPTPTGQPSPKTIDGSQSVGKDVGTDLINMGYQPTKSIDLNKPINMAHQYQLEQNKMAAAVTNYSMSMDGSAKPEQMSFPTNLSAHMSNKETRNHSQPKQCELNVPNVQQQRYEMNRQTNIDLSAAYRSANNTTIDPTLRNLTDLTMMNDSFMNSLQGNSAYYPTKDIPPAHMYNKNLTQNVGQATPANIQQMLNTTMTMAYNRAEQQQQQQQTYQRLQHDLAVMTHETAQSMTPTNPEPVKQKRTRKKKGTATVPQVIPEPLLAPQQQTMMQHPQHGTQMSHQQQPTHAFQSYAGLKSNSPVALKGTVTTSAGTTDTSAIALKTSTPSMVPGSAFNFGPTATGLPLPTGIYADNTGYLDDFTRPPPNPYYLPPAATNPRGTPDQSDKTGGTAPAATSTYHQLLTHPTGRTTYSFMNPPQLDPNSQLYQQYLRQEEIRARMMLGNYAAQTGYHPLGMHKPYDAMNSRSWFP